MLKTWLMGGPKKVDPVDPLTKAADMMRYHAIECLKHASYLEHEIARTRADLDAAQKKLTTP